VTRTSRLARTYGIAIVGVALATATGLVVHDHVTIADQDSQLTFKLSLAPARSRPATRGARWDE